MRDRGNVLYHADFEFLGLKRSDSCFSSCSGSLNVNLNYLESVLLSCLSSSLCSGLCCEGSALLRAAEVKSACACPRYGVALHIGDGNDSVIEGGLDMNLSLFNILSFATTANNFFSLSHVLFSPSLLLLVCNGLYRALAGSCVGLGSLTSYGQTLSVTNAPVAADLDKSLDIKSYFSSKIALNG